MEGRTIVEAMRMGDPSGLAAAYDAYGDRLYGYCWSLLRDQDSASDALHDTLLVAGERIGQLRDPDRLRAWLYTIARHECLRQLRIRRRSVSLEEAGEFSDPSVDLDAGPRDRELRELVRAAAEGLNPGDREVLELAIQHDLDAGEVAAALGLTLNHVHARLSRARDQLERALAAVLVARGGREECAELATILEGWDGRLTALVRKRVNRHLESCPICAERRDRVVQARSLLAALPLALPPPHLRGRIVSDRIDPQLVAYRSQLGWRAGPFDEAGFPRPPRRSRLPRLVAVAAAVALLVAGTTASWYAFGWGKAPAHPLANTSVATPTPSSSAEPASPTPLDSPTPSSSPSPSPSPTPTPIPTPSPTPTPLPSPTPTPIPLPPLVVPAQVALQATPNGGFVGNVPVRAGVPGEVPWTASVSPALTFVRVAPLEGVATMGQTSNVSVLVAGRIPSGRFLITFTYAYQGAKGQVTTVVTWGTAAQP